MPFAASSTLWKAAYAARRMSFASIGKKVRPFKRQTCLPSSVGQLVADGSVERKVYAYSTADSYCLDRMVANLKNCSVFKPLPLNAELQRIVVRLGLADDHCAEAFVFAEGSVVFWNFGQRDRVALLKILSDYEESPYDQSLVDSEEDTLCYVEQKQPGHCSEFENELLLLNTVDSDEADQVLDRFAVSNAMMSSVKLSIWECVLIQFCDSIENVVDSLRRGEILLSKPEVLCKLGELFVLRHRINLDGDLLDTPDFYWDKEKLEKLYSDAFKLFNIAKRTRVVNVRLSYCMELLQLLDGNIAHRHNVRLETMIIVLIFVEILFELFHLMQEQYKRSTKSPSVH